MTLEMLSLFFEVLRFISNLPFFYLLAALLPMRHVKTFFALEITILCLQRIVGLVLPSGVGSPLYVLGSYGLALLFWRERWAYRLLAVEISYCFMMLIELWGGFTWIVLTGTPNASYDAMFAHPAIAIAIRLGFMALSFFGAHELVLVSRKIRADRLMAESSRSFAILIAIQACMLEVLMLIVLMELSDSVACYGAMLCLVLLCFTGDALLFLAVKRSAEARAEEVRIEFLQENLQSCLQDESDLVGRASRIAQLRHDVRNHVQVLRAMIDQGDIEAARTYAQRLAAQAAGGSASETAVSDEG